MSGGATYGGGFQHLGGAPLPGDPSSELFDDEILPEFEIEVDEVGMDALRDDPYRWVVGAITYAGTRYEPVGVRLKGANSFEPVDEKPSLKIDMNRFADLELLGLKSLTFNNMDGDESMTHERVAYRLYREFGVPAARCTHTHVLLNGRDLGLYAHVESVDKSMIGRWRDDDGGMYELTDVDFEPGYSPYDFDLEFGTAAIAELQGSIEALENPDPDVALAALEDFMSVESFIDYFAVSMVVAQYDGYPYSSPGDDAHVYKDPTSEVLVWLPHGVDETLKRDTRDPLEGVRGKVGAVCLASPTCLAQLWDRVSDVLDVMEAIDLATEAERILDQIEPLVLADVNKPYDDAVVAAEQANLLEFLVDRRQDLEPLMGP